LRNSIGSEDERRGEGEREMVYTVCTSGENGEEDLSLSFFLCRVALADDIAKRN